MDQSAAQISIGVIIGGFAGGGAQRDAVLLSNALARLGAKVTVIVLRSEGPLLALLEPNITVLALAPRLRLSIQRLRRAFRDARLDIVLSSEASLNIACVLAGRSLSRRHRPAVILREVGVPSAGIKNDPYIQNRLAYRMARFYRLADHVITLTEGARRDLIDLFGVPEAMISVLHTKPVITPDVAAALTAAAPTSRRQAGRIVTVGRLSAEKGHRDLIHAMAFMPQNINWQLFIVGEGRERPQLERLAARLGLGDRITFVGYAEDPFAWLQGAELAVSSSLYEGFGNSLVEALACGTPVVAIDCPYGPREILDHGLYGRLVPTREPRDLAAAIAGELGRHVNRDTLRQRGLQHRTDRSAEEFLGIAEPIGALARRIRLTTA
ncbi:MULTISPECIES: glycosyltransferase [unclassified Chelatococcus]|uniref:glycosyltransferase n=1 Tax=unclassified Chelatococcus TaxID=2638111 RepID=UPI001BD09C37|nr:MULTISPECIES: glycosyltransferase [unclassified Chelatococcus]MBS7697323.1 glycosyltransferase [Chelatococcus sp. YT9]MBX3556380.1 glycosyltransferase [Chelatococcus sp.]